MTVDEKIIRKKRRRAWIWLIVLTLILGSLVSFTIPRPVVGVIYLDDAIYSFTANEIIQQIHHAYDSPTVRTVVLVLNSPGGTVTDTESVYLELARLREKKPVVTVVEGMSRQEITGYRNPVRIVARFEFIRRLPRIVRRDKRPVEKERLFSIVRRKKLYR